MLKPCQSANNDKFQLKWLRVPRRHGIIVQRAAGFVCLQNSHAAKNKNATRRDANFRVPRERFQQLIRPAFSVQTKFTKHNVSNRAENLGDFWNLFFFLFRFFSGRIKLDEFHRKQKNYSSVFLVERRDDFIIR